MIILLHVKCKESIAVIKLRIAYTGLSIKSREKTIVRASDKVQEKFLLCGMLKAKVQFDMSNWLLPNVVLPLYENIFKIFVRLFLLFMLKKQDNNTICHLIDKQSSKQKPQLLLLQAT